MKCGDCRHWGPSPESSRNERHRTCGAVKFQDDDYGEIVPPETLAYVMDGSGYFAALKCREDFGCVLFEGKP